MLRKFFSVTEARLPIGVLIFCLGTTLILSIAVFRYEENSKSFLFERRANLRINAVTDEINEVTNALKDVNSAMTVFAPVNRMQFHEMTQTLMGQYPEIQYFGFQKAMPTQRMTRAATGLLYPVKAEYLEFAPNSPPQIELDTEAALGWQQALSHAIATRHAISTNPFFLVGQKSMSPSIAIIMPVLKPTDAESHSISGSMPASQSIAGYTFVVFQASVVVANALRQFELKQHFDMQMNINAYAADSADETKLIFRSGNPPAVSSMYLSWLRGLLYIHLNRVTRQLDMANSHWYMVISCTHPISLFNNHLDAWLVLFGGLSISVLAWRYLLVTNTRSRHIQRMVDERTVELHERTAELQERTAELQEANERLYDDIAMRMAAERALRRSQYRLTAAQKIAHLASWEYDVKTGQLQCSDEYFRICGLKPQSFKPSIEHAFSVTHPDDRERVKRAMEDAIADGANYRVEKRIVRPDGSIRHVITQGEKIYDSQGEVVAFVGAFLDITPHKEAEIALRQSREQLRQLAARQESVREDERKRIAREVHDELGALLTTIKSFLSVSVERSQSAGATPDPLVVDAVNIADSAINSVRRIITDLRPSVLDHLGIWAALEWQLDQIQKQTNLVCEYTIHPDAASIELGIEHSVALFRITQEALTNVIRHADASRIEVHATCADNILLVQIQDDGKGFHVEGQYDRHAWGLLGMHERARHFGGEVNIVTNHLQGTTVTLRLPLNQESGVENPCTIELLE